jgi:hypothetical protein
MTGNVMIDRGQRAGGKSLSKTIVISADWRDGRVPPRCTGAGLDADQSRGPARETRLALRCFAGCDEGAASSPGQVLRPEAYFWVGELMSRSTPPCEPHPVALDTQAPSLQ